MKWRRFFTAMLTVVALVLIFASSRSAPATVLARSVSPQGSSDDLFSAVELRELSLSGEQARRLAIFRSQPTTAALNLVRVRFDVLERGGEVNLNVFPGENVRLRTDRIEERGPQDYSWFGQDPGDPSRYAILVVLGDEMAGTVQSGRQLVEVRPLGGDLHAVVRVDQSAFPEDGPPGFGPIVQQAIAARQPVPQVAGAGIPEDGSITTVLVAYTSAAAARAADLSGSIDTHIQLAIDQTNQSYGNSQITPRLQLTYKYLTRYTESGNMGTDVGRFTDTADGYMDEVHIYRNYYVADVAILLTGRNMDYCGMAWQYMGESRAFGVVHADCVTGNYSFAHEIGHIQGAQHNPEQDQNPHFPYGHGYYYKPGHWRTIMSYEPPPNPPWDECAPILYWSNPNVSYNGVPMGTSTVHDNARVLNETARTLANYRTPSFADVPVGHSFLPYIEALKQAGFVAGCGGSPPRYCPDAPLIRAESAVFILRGAHGASYVPPITDEQIFEDVPPGTWYFHWVNALWKEGFTAGCGTAPLIYCPLWPNTRAEAAVFFLHMLHGAEYQAPPITRSRFADVPLAAWYAKWVERAYRDGLMDPCAQPDGELYFCPATPITRARAAQIMARAKGLPLLEPHPRTNATRLSNDLSLTSGTVLSSPWRPAPVLKYGTYLGGSNEDVGNSVAVDSHGNLYVVGYTDSPDFPGTATLRGDRDVFVAKLEADGSGPVYVTYLGGSGLDEGYDIAVDGTGNAYVVGYTDSADFTTRNPLQPTHGGERDAFVAKLDAGGNLAYSTYFGGSGADEGYAIVVDSAGSAYVAGRTYSTDFPLGANPKQASNAGGFDAFVAKLSANGTLAYSTYLGGSGSDAAHGLAVGGGGQVYVTGDTGSADFPTQDAWQGSLGGGQDAFVARLDAAGSQLVYSTYLGGSGGDQGQDIALDGDGNAYVTGHAGSTDFPTASARQSTHGGSAYDAFAAKLSSDGHTLLFSTYLGGSGGDEGTSIAVSGEGTVYVTGYTGSLDLSTVTAWQAVHSGSFDVFVATLSAGGDQMLSNTYLGGDAGDVGTGIAVDRLGSVYVTGYTLSQNLPTARPFQALFGGDRDAFLMKIREEYSLYLPLVER